jgi:hypothetical protein
MAKKDNTALMILGLVAVAGYFAFRSGGFLNKTAQPSAALQGGGSAPAQFSNPNDTGIATELPTAQDIGVYVPSLDPTGMPIQFF